MKFIFIEYLFINYYGNLILLEGIKVSFLLLIFMNIKNKIFQKDGDQILFNKIMKKVIDQR